MTVKLQIKVKPRSSKEGVELQPDGSLVVKVSAAPVDGEANARVLEVLAAALGIRKSDLAITRGETARHKEITAANLTLDDVKSLLAPTGQARGGRR
jgi:uncharacterized protein